MEEKYDVLELASEMLEAETEQDWEAILEKCVKILPMFESKEEKIAFLKSAIIESVLEYMTVLTGKVPQSRKGRIIIHL